MIALLQRVLEARVIVNEECIGEIAHGLLVFVGVERNDGEEQAERLLQRILQYRVFADDKDKMNYSLSDINGGLLLVPQFTLAATTDKGNRPGFQTAANPEQGERLFNSLLSSAKQQHSNVQQGRFGADMKVSLINDGPVTFWLQVTAS